MALLHPEISQTKLAKSAQIKRFLKWSIFKATDTHVIHSITSGIIFFLGEALALECINGIFEQPTQIIRGSIC